MCVYIIYIKQLEHSREAQAASLLAASQELGSARRYGFFFFFYIGIFVYTLYIPSSSSTRERRRLRRYWPRARSSRRPAGVCVYMYRRYICRDLYI